MTATEPSTLVKVVTILAGTYTDEGVLIWLMSPNKHLPLNVAGGHYSPRGAMADRHEAAVLEAAERIEGQTWEQVQAFRSAAAVPVPVPDPRETR